MVGVGEMCLFQRKTGHVSETVKDTAKVTNLLLICNRKWHTPFQMK